MTISTVSAIFVPLITVAATLYLLGTGRLAYLRLRARPQPDADTPVTVLKPMSGTFPDLAAAVESFFQQDHREYQIVFGFRCADDPAREVVEKLRQLYPKVDCEVVLAGPDLGANRKVTAIHYMMAKAKYDLILIADDDVLVSPDYASRMVSSMRDPTIGAVTSLYRVDPRSLGLAFDALTRATELLPLVAVAEWMERGLSFTLGASTLLRRQAIDQFGGIKCMADYLAEDYLLGAKLRENGWSILLSTELVGLCHDFRSISEYLSHQQRWSRTYRYCRPVGYLFSILTHGVLFALLYVSFSGAGSIALALAIAVAAIRVVTAVFDILLGGSASLLLYLPLLPLRDLLSAYFWATSFLGNTVRWRGRSFRVSAGGRIAPLQERCPRLLNP